MRFNNTHRPQGRDLGLVPLTTLGDVLVGTTTVEVAKPAGCTIIVLRVDNGNFFVVPGQFSDFASDDFDQDDFESLFDDPATTTYGESNEGQAPWKLAEGVERAFLCPSYLSFKGDTGDAKMYFYFV